MSIASRSIVIAACIASLAVALTGNATAATPTLYATVGPSDTIVLRTASGAVARTVKAGTYTIVVNDRSTDHNFHLVGPGVNKMTSIAGTGKKIWRGVRFARGKTYRFVCDPHTDDMRGSVRAR